MRKLPETLRWLLAPLSYAIGLASGMFLGVGLEKLAWETGFIDGDSGMEIIR